jgi:hypothetical protein
MVTESGLAAHRTNVHLDNKAGIRLYLRQPRVQHLSRIYDTQFETCILRYSC